MPHYHSYKRNTAPHPISDEGLYPAISSGAELDSSFKAEASALAPYTAPYSATSSLLPEIGTGVEAAAGKAAGGFSLANLGGMIERLGGLDGILATVGKVQKVMQTVQQFAPMAKLVAGFLPGGKALKLQGDSDDKHYEYRPRRKRKSTHKRNTRKRSTGTSKRKRNSKNRR